MPKRQSVPQRHSNKTTEQQTSEEVVSIGPWTTDSKGQSQRDQQRLRMTNTGTSDGSKEGQDRIVGEPQLPPEAVAS